MYSDFISELNAVVDDFALERGYILRDGFVFESIHYPANVFSALVVRNPSSARDWGDNRFVSQRSLEEHIDLINTYQIESAVIIAENIRFLSRCPSLKHIVVIPAESVETDFDFSPLYEHKEIRSIFCATNFGKFHTKNSEMDYSKLHGLVALRVQSNSDLQYRQIQSLKSLDVNYMQVKTLPELFSSNILDTLQITSCGIHTLDGIGISPHLQCLYLHNNRSLRDITGLLEVAPSIRALRIENCPKIKDFSVLHQLENLEYLFLKGSNKIPDLSFIASMPKLKTFVFDMEIMDGNLLPCLELSYAHCGKMKQHYNVKAKDLPKCEYFRGNSNIEDWRKVP